MFLILESLQFRHAVYTHFLHRAYKYNFAVVISVVYTEKVKVAQTGLPSVGFRSWSRFLAVSLQVVGYPAVSCHIRPTFRQACSYPRNP